MAHGRGDSRGYIFVMADRPEDPAAGTPLLTIESILEILSHLVKGAFISKQGLQDFIAGL
jgi:hypothetical protein